MPAKQVCGRYRFINAMLALVLLTPAARAADDSGEDDPERQLPNVELLEFLGSFETDTGEWVSPVDLIETEFGLLLQATYEEAGSNTKDNSETEITQGSNPTND